MLSAARWLTWNSLKQLASIVAVWLPLPTSARHLPLIWWRHYVDHDTCKWGRDRQRERVAERTQRHKATAAPKKCWGTHILVDVERKQEAQPGENQRRNPLGVFGQGIKYNWCWALRKCSLVSSAVACNRQQATAGAALCGLKEWKFMAKSWNCGSRNCSQWRPAENCILRLKFFGKARTAA